MNSDLSNLKIRYFIGIDISKHTLDFAVIEHQEPVVAATILNEPDAIKSLLKSFKSLPGFSVKKTLFCCESTGLYGNLLLQCLQQIKALIVVENPLHIKLSMGLIRDKTDKKDAHRIALFAKRHQPELRHWQVPRPAISRLQQLLTARDRLVLVGKILKTSIKENDIFTGVKQAAEVNGASAKTLKAVNSDLEKIERTMAQIIKSDGRLAYLNKLVSSVTGIGKQTSLQIIISTNEFKKISDPKKFACYVGVAPFRSESGLSVSRARVSHFAAKKMKSLLHICALNAVRWDPEIRAYFQRKMEVDKKPKMAVINAVRNKLIKRVFACVHQDRVFIKSQLRMELTSNQNATSDEP